MPITSRRDDVAAYTTRDGSQIRELAHPAVHGNTAQSLAEATVLPGSATRLHRHDRSEEVYHVIAGNAVLTLGAERLAVTAGDTIVIPQGTPHRLENRSAVPLVVLCACAPAYAHDDTTLLD